MKEIFNFLHVLLVVGIQTGIPAAGFSQQQVRGLVFEDRNGNGKRDDGEPGLAGISVTNGRAVVQTDSGGGYVLPATDDMIVSVIKPSGFGVPVNELNQPQFYYIHKPKGSPPDTYTGVAPTGPLPASVDFALVKQDEPSAFNVLVFGDPQPNTLEDVMSFEKAIVSEVVDNSDAAFGLSLGDLVGDDLDLYPAYKRVVAKIGVPWYNAYGNHDMNRDNRQDSLADETFEAHFGPANYAFNYGNAHFIVLDDVLFPDPRNQRTYYGGLREDVLEFVANDLKYVPHDKLIVIAFHIPMVPFEERDPFRKSDQRRLFQLLKDYPHTLSLSSHTHAQNHFFFTEKEGGWLGDGIHHHYNVGAAAGDGYKGPKDRYGTPASYMRDGTPKGHMYLRIHKNSYEYDYKVSGESSDYRMSVHIPKIVPAAKKYRGEIVVNFFQGSPRDTLEYRVDGGAWQPLERVPRFDKYLLQLEHEWDYAEALPWGIRLSTPVLSSHIWSAQMPSSFSLGTHLLEVRATDWLGRQYFAKKEFRMVLDHSD